MEKIAQKLKTQFYDNVDELAADFMLMFENACKYNEPDSQIYKDSLLLQQVCIQTKQSLRYLTVFLIFLINFSLINNELQTRFR